MDSLTSSDDQPIPPAKPQPQVPTGKRVPNGLFWKLKLKKHRTMTAPLSVSCCVLHLVSTHSKLEFVQIYYFCLFQLASVPNSRCTLHIT